MESRFHLDNPPIKEVALGIFIKNSKYDIDFINNFVKNNMNGFTNIEPFNTVDIQISKDNKIKVLPQNENASYMFTNKTKEEMWNIDLKRILFSDKSKYSSFDNFLKKFLNKYKILYSSLEKNLAIDYMALRYSNEFSFKIDELDKNFAILPLFIQEFDKKQYSANTSYMCINSIVNSENDKMHAQINTRFIVDEKNTTKLSINFDIEVGYVVMDKNITENKLKDYLSEMREFKNKIFFSNVLKAKEVFKKNG